MSKRNPCGIWPQFWIILSEPWWSVNYQPAAADVGSLDLHSETTKRSVFKRVLPRLCHSFLTSVEHRYSALHHGGTRQSPCQKGETERMIYSSRDEGTSASHPFLYYHSAAGCIYPYGIVFMLLNALLSLCSQVYPSTCLFQRMDRKGRGTCEMREKWFICLHLLPCWMSASAFHWAFCSFLTFPGWKYSPDEDRSLF